jgi:hypothetical protein
MMAGNKSLDYYLVAPDGALLVRRKEENRSTPILTGLNTSKASPIWDELLDSKRRRKNLSPVNNSDPIGGNYDPSEYRPPGYDDPNAYRCIGCYSPAQMQRDREKREQDRNPDSKNMKL